MSPACATHGPVPPWSFGTQTDPDPQLIVPRLLVPHTLAEGVHVMEGAVPDPPGVHVPPSAPGAIALQKAGYAPPGMLFPQVAVCPFALPTVDAQFIIESAHLRCVEHSAPVGLLQLQLHVAAGAMRSTSRYKSIGTGRSTGHGLSEPP
jgi:hypothetical protein